MKKHVSLKKLYENGIKTLKYGGDIVKSHERYGLYSPSREVLLLRDGENVDFGDFEDNGEYISGMKEHDGNILLLSKEEYAIAVFE